MKIDKPDLIATAIDAWHETHGEPPRPHMGCSMLGHACDRWLWIQFRWAVTPKFPGRVLRLFRRGHNEEATVVADLRAIGVDVQNTGRNQKRVDFGAHVSGSVDGIIESGLPGAPKARAILEIKTHGDKSFKDLQAKGVQASKPMHWVQMCVYGSGLNIQRALYVAVNKNTDEIYTEWLHLDAAVAEKAINRGRTIALSDRMPPPLSTDQTWYECKLCEAHSFCHSTKLTKEVNCRTCAHATATPESTWKCERHQADGIPVEFQRAGCECHALHPDLVPWQMGEARDEWTPVYIINGTPVANCEGDANVYSSREIVANAAACSSGDEMLAALRAGFGGEIVK